MLVQQARPGSGPLVLLWRRPPVRLSGETMPACSRAAMACPVSRCGPPQIATPRHAVAVSAKLMQGPGMVSRLWPPCLGCGGRCVTT
jgi:hypothetical protein